MKKQTVLLPALLLSITSCNIQVEDKRTTIDDAMQDKVTSLLENKIIEEEAMSGQVIVMETKTGAIKAMVGLERKDSLSPILPMEVVDKPRESGLFRAISLLAMLESGKLDIDDEVDTRGGVLALPDTVMCDHNWRNGGYGTLSALKSFSYYSVVAHTHFLQRAFANENEYAAQIEKMLAVCPDSVQGIKRMDCPTESPYYENYLFDAIGYHKTSPLQILSFYNAIANFGQMVQPRIYVGTTKVINLQIANPSNTDAMQATLITTVGNGVGRKARSDYMYTAGASGKIELGDNNFQMDFCGYFPAEDPQYTVLVSMNKQKTPASASFICGTLFKEIAESIAIEGDFTYYDIRNQEEANDIYQIQFTPQIEGYTVKCEFCPLDTFDVDDVRGQGSICFSKNGKPVLNRVETYG